MNVRRHEVIGKYQQGPDIVGAISKNPRAASNGNHVGNGSACLHSAPENPLRDGAGGSTQHRNPENEFRKIRWWLEVMKDCKHNSKFRGDSHAGKKNMLKKNRQICKSVFYLVWL